MSDKGIGFGGFLIGLGGGYYLFRYIDASFDFFSYLLILMGIGIIANALLSKGRRPSPIGGAFGGLVGGLILALFITQGFGFIEDIAGDPVFDSFDSKAEETRTLTGDVTQGSLDFMVRNYNGVIFVETWDSPEYKIDLHIEARANTDAKAQENLEKLKEELTDTIQGGSQQVSLEFDNPFSEWTFYSITITVFLPEDVLNELDLQTSNGAIFITDVICDTAILDTSNGMIEFDGLEAVVIDASTSNGKITGLLQGEEVDLSTSNGSVDLNLPCTISGEYKIDTSNGGISITVPDAGNIGYDIDADTSLGNINVNLDNLDYTRNEDKHVSAKTEGYDSRAIQIVLEVETSIGGIDIN